MARVKEHQGGPRSAQLHQALGQMAANKPAGPGEEDSVVFGEK